MKFTQRLMKFGRSLSKRIFWRQHLQESIKLLDRLKPKFVSSDIILATAFAFRGHGIYESIQAKQNATELKGLVDFLKSSKLNRVCEIGTHKGGTLFVWCQISEDNGTIISIDLPGGAFGGGFNTRSIPLFESFKRPGQKLFFIRGNSQSKEAVCELESILDKSLLDFILIDGDHTFTGVKRDFELYSRFVRPGGVIAFHDIIKRDRYPDIEVWRFWDEIKKQYDAIEFIDNSGTEPPVGIGVLRWPGENRMQG